MKRIKCLSFLLLLPLLFCSCRNAGWSEPEQVYMVSAIGFDGLADGELRMSVEVPLTRESEAEGMETKLFTGVGSTVESAMRQINAGLAKKLLFSHCALMVLGDGLTRDQLEAAFTFVSRGENLPLAAQVVASPDASELLSGGSLSTPAAGYDIPGIFKQESGIMGLDVRSAIYELRANASPRRPIVLPYFRASGEDSAQSAQFIGLRILKEGMQAVNLLPEESVYYAMLAGLYAGANGSPGSLGGVELNRVRSELYAERDGEVLHLTFTLTMNLVGRQDAETTEQMRAHITEELQTCFSVLRERAGTDVFFFSDRLAGEQKELWAELEPDYENLFAGADLTVKCQLHGKESGSI